ncbi:ATP-dependent DNA helicase Q1-like [Dermacentor variabilis]|uniref:ATP-dependent DNA helicase Q1-like n=1 Tax=Dermacentor variabilis TaxID=34621 RepID=UPI003F5C64AD
MALLSWEEELRKVEKELISTEKEIVRLSTIRECLTRKKHELTVKLKQKSLDEIARTDWSRSDFPWSNRVNEVLENMFHVKRFRSMQLPAINVTLSNKDCILIMPTGGGKSLCYQLPALISKGVTIVVSPLLSLMEDQVMALEAMSYPVAMLAANVSVKDTNRILKAMADGEDSLKLLYVTPEKMAKSKRFMSMLGKAYQRKHFARLAIDEVHCCSQWGNDFRPDYKYLAIMKREFPEVPILGVTATASAAIVADVQKMLDIESSVVLRAPLDRPNLVYEVLPKPSGTDEAVKNVAKLILGRFKDQCGIVYCFSIKETDELAEELKGYGIAADSYHASMQPQRRSNVHTLWMHGKLLVIVATIAFGMGIDKPNVRFVIHHTLSKSVENYYQESGRAGRDDQPATCLILFRFADIFRQTTSVFTEKCGRENVYTMVRYCVDVRECRRAMFLRHFGERHQDIRCHDGICDNCRLKETVKDIDVTVHIKNIYKVLSAASEAKEQLTATKLIDAWMGKDAKKWKERGITKTDLPRERCETIVAWALLEGYLAEKFHITPYAYISYIHIGERKQEIDKGEKVRCPFLMTSVAAPEVSLPVSVKRHKQSKRDHAQSKRPRSEAQGSSKTKSQKSFSNHLPTSQDVVVIE